MLVYCDADDCKNNEDGMCECKWPSGVEAIKLSFVCVKDDWYSDRPGCTDYEPKPEQWG